MDEVIKFIYSVTLKIYNFSIIDYLSRNHDEVLQYREEVYKSFLTCQPFLSMKSSKRREDDDTRSFVSFFSPPPEISGSKPPTVFQIKKYRYGTRADGSDRILYRFYIGTRFGAPEEGDIYAHLYYGEILDEGFRIVAIDKVMHRKNEPHFQYEGGELIIYEALELLESVLTCDSGFSRTGLNLSKVKTIKPSRS